MGIDPTGESFSVNLTISIGIGATIGGIDAALGGGDIFDIAEGALVGAAFGAAFGAIGFAYPTLMASKVILGIGLGVGTLGAFEAFHSGKNAQGVFRVFTGIAAPLALRQAAMARLTGLLRQARLSIAKMWKQLPLRKNFYVEPGIPGSNVPNRIALTPDVEPGPYMYVVDAKGKMWLLKPGGDAKHSSILPEGAQARAAGWLKINPDRTAKINTRSGHYMQELPLSPEQEGIWLQAITEQLLVEGNAAVQNASSQGSIL